MSVGETDLSNILKGLKPKLHSDTCVFVTLNEPDQGLIGTAIAYIREEEGVSIILEKSLAQSRSLAFEYESAWITLEIHSSLEGVGLTALFSQALASENISCNVVAGYYHDHIFVPVSLGKKAMRILENLGK